MRTQRLLAYAFIAGLGLLSAGSAMAARDNNPNSLLSGSYQFNQNQTCLSVPGGDFGPPGLAITATGFTDFAYLAGVLTFDGVGNVTGHDHGISLPGNGPSSPNSSPVGTFADNCSGTYKVRRDGSFIIHTNCAGTDGSYTLTGLQFKGQISPDGSVWTDIAAEPVVTTLTLNNGVTIKRICGAHAIAVRIQPH
jgi:hypothetical protein